METVNKKEILEKLKIDENYYGKFGKQFLSNSDISTLLTNPLSLGTPMENRPAFLIGGYFHTAILEPEKLKNFKIIEATTRNTKAYKEISNGEICLLQQEVDKTEKNVSRHIITRRRGAKQTLTAQKSKQHVLQQQLPEQPVR